MRGKMWSNHLATTFSVAFVDSEMNLYGGVCVTYCGTQFQCFVSLTHVGAMLQYS